MKECDGCTRAECDIVIAGYMLCAAIPYSGSEVVRCCHRQLPGAAEAAAPKPLEQRTQLQVERHCKGRLCFVSPLAPRRAAVRPQPNNTICAAISADATHTQQYVFTRQIIQEKYDLSSIIVLIFG